jgi:hypothetical protein
MLNLTISQSKLHVNPKIQRQNMTTKIDYAKIIIIGTVLFAMIWGLLFIF